MVISSTVDVFINNAFNDFISYCLYIHHKNINMFLISMYCCLLLSLYISKNKLKVISTTYHVQLLPEWVATLHICYGLFFNEEVNTNNRQMVTGVIAFLVATEPSTVWMTIIFLHTIYTYTYLSRRTVKSCYNNSFFNKTITI